MTTLEPVTKYLDLLGYSTGDFVGVCYKTDSFNTAVLPAADVPTYIAGINPAADIWIGINPVGGPVRIGQGRGGAEDVTRLSALYCDLDVKATGCDSFETGQQIIDDLSGILGTPPTFTVMSGHGWQPYWVLEDGQRPADEMAGLLSRFGRLVRLVADTRKAKVDSVFDLARILRAPGTFNNKDDVPIAVEMIENGGAPLVFADVEERLDEYGIVSFEGDGVVGEIVSPATDWDWATQPCRYVTSMIKSWLDEPVGDRHPWALGCQVRLECARRYGCVMPEQYQQASDLIADRLRNLRASTNETVKPNEIRDIRIEAERRAASKSESEVARELGGHNHLMDGPNVVQGRSGGGKGHLSVVGGGGAAAAPKTPPPTPAPTAAGTNGVIQYTDAWNAERLIAARQYDLHYIPERGRKGWITWNGTHWQHESDSGAVQYAAFEVIRDWVTIAGDDDAFKFKKKSLNAKGLGDMVKVAQQSPHMRVSEKSMDAKPYSLNTPDGIIDLKTGELQPHQPTEWHSRIAGCGYNPEATDKDCPKWIAFLHTTFGGDQNIIHYIQRLLGYALVGEVTEHILPFFWGPKGFNGKSCLLNLMQAIMGSYAEVASGNFLLQGHKPHEEEIASMHGARIVICSEINEGSKFDEARTKQFTGGDRIQGRHLYGSTFVFEPSHTLFVMGNERPHVPVGGNSFFRRFKLIGFDHQVPEQDRVQRYEDVLLAEEGPAILAWMVRGVIDMLANGIQTPEGVQAATDEFAAEEDAVGQFISQCTMTDEDDYTTCGDLYAEYTKWCKNNGEDAKPSKTFMQDVYQRGYRKGKVSDGAVRVVRGLKLLASPPPYTPQSFWNS